MLDGDISTMAATAGEVMRQTAEAKELAERIKFTGEELGKAIDNVARKAGEAADQSGAIMSRAGVSEISRRSGKSVQFYHGRIEHGHFAEPESKRD